jgi:hypothetical protein
MIPLLWQALLGGGSPDLSCETLLKTKRRICTLCMAKMTRTLKYRRLVLGLRHYVEANVGALTPACCSWGC